MRNKNYFFGNTKGLNADIERHRKERDHILKKIEDIEKNDAGDEGKQRAIKVYKQCLLVLEESNAEVVSKIGKKKKP